MKEKCVEKRHQVWARMRQNKNKSDALSTQANCLSVKSRESEMKTKTIRMHIYKL